VLFCAGVAIAQKTKNLTVDVELVQVYATVTNDLGQYVLALEKEHFQITEDRVAQKIEHFSTEDVPISVGFIFDVSSSMSNNLTLAKNAAVTFMKKGGPEDEYFLVEFNDRAKLTIDFTTDITKLQNHILFLPAKGSTALNDGLYLGLEKVKQGSNTRKILVLISDGGENNSRYSISDVRELAQEANTQIFTILVVPRGAEFDYFNPGSFTGGGTFNVRSMLDVADVCEKIAIEVKNQYILTYRSTNEARDGKWRRIAVRVNPPLGLRKLSVRAKQGYYAPRQ
jgi:Ca-activated chloride channel family protein